MKKRNQILVQGGILASVGLVTKVIGFVYRIPMANILGNEGNGIYSVAFGIYNIALTLSSYSMPVALSKLYAEKLSRKDEAGARKIFSLSILLAVFLGTIAFGMLFFGADFLAGAYRKEGLQYPLKILAPTTLVVALLGCFRGYFQGWGNMIPTAISQTIEQIFNAIFSIIGALYFVGLFSCCTNTGAAKAAGGTFGTLVGAVAALVFFIGVFILSKRENILEKCSNQRNIANVTYIFNGENRKYIRLILLTMIPIILSQTVYQIGYTMDDFIFSQLMADKGLSDKAVTEIQGVFNTQYNQLINVPIAVATALSTAMLPNLVTSFTKKRTKDVQSNINQLFATVMMVIFPAMAGLSICASPIMKVLFSGLGDYQMLAVNLLKFGSIAALAYALSTVTSSILQGCNRMYEPVKNAAVSLTIHIILIIVLLTKTNLGIYALLIGDILFPSIIAVLNIIKIKKVNQGLKTDYFNIVIRPLLSTVVMVFVIMISMKIMDRLDVGSIIYLIGEIVIGCIAYGIMYFKVTVTIAP